MTYSLKFTLDGLPPMKNPSGRKSTHWRYRYADRKEWQTRVKLACTGKKPHKPLAKAKLILTRHSSVAPDPDGLVMGFADIVDGLIKAAVIKDDKLDVIDMPDYRWKYAPRNKGFVEVEVSGEFKPKGEDDE